MKFAKYLEVESIPEWRRAYINYNGLKKRLKAIEKYRRLSQTTENKRPEQIINELNELNGLNSDDSESQIPNSAPSFQKKRPTRTQSNILDNRSSGLQARSISMSRGLLSRVSSHFSNRHGIDMGKLTKPSIQDELYSLSILEEALRHVSEPEHYFFVMLDQDLEIISRFYDEKEKEAEAKYAALEIQVKLVQDFAKQLSQLNNPSHDIMSGDGHLNPMNWFRTHNGPHHRTSEDSNMTANIPDLLEGIHYNAEHHMSYNVARSRLKKAIVEFYRSLDLLKSYKILNKTGFEKILKKFDKTAGWKASNLYLQKIRKYHWMESDKIDNLLHDTETLYIDEFADGHRRRGMSKLRIPERNNHYTPATWRIGFYIGLSLAFLARVLQLALDPNVAQQLPNMYYNLQIYACFSLPILFCLGFSVNALVWTRSRINYKFIFEFDPRDNLDYHEFAELPSLVLLLLSFIMYIDFSQSFAPTIPSELCPLILFVIISAAMTCPFPIFYYSSRRWLGLTLGRIILSYCFPIEFRDFFIADELNSLAYSFWTFSYFICAYRFHWQDLSVQCPVKMFWFTPLIASLPPWWRFLQCIRRFQDSQEKVHLVNACKYVTSIAATLMTGYRRMHPNSGAVEVVWMLSCIVNSSYTSIWDINMDWGLLQMSSRNFLLRDELVFYKWLYYVAVPLNIALRFAWALNNAGLGIGGDLVSYVVALLEVYRRIQWNFFRLENEHINNCGNYRAIKEIPLPFAMRDNKPIVGDANPDEEGGIQLPVESNASAISVDSATALPTHHAIGAASQSGTFYGRRDFENRHDLDDQSSSAVNLNRPAQQPSIAGIVLNRIKSRKGPSAVDSDTDNDEEEDSD